jgi:UDP-3-O-acyl N-acetylglucosamine deacetylase
MERQHTIARETDFQGIGLHTGNLCRAVFKPSPPDSGVTLIRTDLPGAPSIKAHYTNVLGVIRGTTVGTDGMRVHTIEHMLSAICALGLDNLQIELNANEPPVADGSSQGFFDALQEVGLAEQNASREFCQPTEPFEYRSGETQILLEPADRLTLTTTIVFKHPLIQQQEVTVAIDPSTYRREIAPARTFCFDYEVEALKKQGLVRGGSLDNAVVIGLDRIHNKEKKLRFPNEFARHKALDLLGDLFLLGRPLKGHITAVRCGHGHNINFVRELAAKFIERGSYVVDRS